MTAAFRYACGVTAAAVLLVANAWSAQAAPAAVVGEVKWHPGHYVLVSPRDRQENYLYKNFRGIQKMYDWRALEPEKDHYDFRQIRSDLEFLGKHERRLVIQIQTKAFRAGQNCCPAYLSGAEYGGGLYKTGAGAFNPIIWDNRVNQRLTALYRELGKQLDREPYLEAVVIPETAITGNVQGQGEAPFTMEKYARAQEDGMQAARDAFPHTVVIQYTNLPQETLQELADYARVHGIGFGGPDIFIQDARLNDPQKGAYRWYKVLSGIVPLGTAVQPEDYTVRMWHGPVDPPSVKELYEFGRDNLHLNYMFWCTREGYFEKVQAMMEDPFFPKDPAGGLDATRPKNVVGPAVHEVQRGG